MKKIKYIVILVSISIIFITGCERVGIDSREIVDLSFIKITGIDCSKKFHDGVRMTIASKEIETGEGGGASGKDLTGILSSDGKSILDVVNRFNLYSDEELYWGHNEIILVSEKTAHKSIFKFLDFFIRDNNMSPDMLVFVTKGCTAEEIIRQGSDDKHFVVDRINNTIESLEYVSNTSKEELINIINRYYMKNCGNYIPYVRLKEDKVEEDEDKKMDIIIDGYAIFDRDKMIKHINGREARGLSYVINKVQSGDIYINDKEGKIITLEIINYNLDIKPKIESDEISIDISVNVKSNVEEYLGRQNIFMKDYLEFLNKQQEESIKKDIESILKIMKENNTDLAAFNSKVYHKYPNEWEKYKDKWAEIFPEVKFNIEVNGRIGRTYSIEEPVYIK